MISTKSLPERLRGFGDITSFADPLEPVYPLSHYFHPDPIISEIHFIVEKPADQSKYIFLRGSTYSDHGRTSSIWQAQARLWCVLYLGPVIAPNTVVVDKSYDLMEAWSAPIKTLPGDIFQLLLYVSKDLTEDEKVPLSHCEFSRLLSQGVDEKNICSEADLEQLFRPSEDENADYLWSIYLFPTIHRSPPDESGTEASYISFWDRNIRDILAAIITEGQTRCIRDGNQDTSTILQRAGFALLTGGICAFRGEEKPPVYSGTHPRDELTEKMVWTYDPAPYILGRPFSSNALALLFICVCPGYFAVGTDVTLVAISPLSDLTELVQFDLSFRRQRVRMVAYIIKLCSIIQALRTVIGRRDFEEFAPIVRP
jgi:hypothetical protein